MLYFSCDLSALEMFIETMLFSPNVGKNKVFKIAQTKNLKQPYDDECVIKKGFYFGEL